jgi:hypothetical protein
MKTALELLAFTATPVLLCLTAKTSSNLKIAGGRILDINAKYLEKRYNISVPKLKSGGSTYGGT